MKTQYQVRHTSVLLTRHSFQKKKFLILIPVALPDISIIPVASNQSLEFLGEMQPRQKCERHEGLPMDLKLPWETICLPRNLVK